MITKFGKFENTNDMGGTFTETIVGAVVEKTENNYVEVLFCPESITQKDGETILGRISTDEFTVYVGKTVNEVLAMYSATNPTWTQALEEV